MLSMATNDSQCFWDEDFLFESTKVSQQLVVTCYVGRTDAEMGKDMIGNKSGHSAFPNEFSEKIVYL